MIERIVFLQNDAANEALEILDQKGEQAALDYLTQCHYPGEHKTSYCIDAAKCDSIYEDNGYVLTYNTNLNYISLEYRV